VTRRPHTPKQRKTVGGRKTRNGRENTNDRQRGSKRENRWGAEKGGAVRAYRGRLNRKGDGEGGKGRGED